MGAGKSAGKSRLSGKRSEDRSAKRHKPALAAPAQRGSIRQFLQPLPQAPRQRGGDASRDSSTEPEDDAGQLPSQTPGMPLLAADAAPPTGAPTGAGAMLQTALLRSLQHRFATQQALDTPAGWPPRDAQQEDEQQEAAQPQQVQHDAPTSPRDDDEDSFQIFSQLAYEPTFLSQRPPELDAEPGGGTSQVATQTQAELGSSQWNNGPAGSRAPAGSLAAAAGFGAAEAANNGGGEGDDLDWPPASQQCTQPHSQPPQPDEAVPRASGVALKTTPALQSVERVQVDGGGASDQKMFPLFRRRDGCKRLYIVRHGESTCNAAMAARGSGWADPQIFDAQLTDKGKQQARALRQELAKLSLPPDTLWITSPLQRAMQTLLLACPHAHLLGEGSGGGHSASGSAENSSAVPNGGGGAAPKVAVLHTITEKVITCGDIGHPASELRKLYPQLEWQLAGLPEMWWHCPPGKPNCALQKRFGSSESKDLVLSRIGAFRRWLQEQPEKVVVAVGHSSYWRHFEEVCRGTKPTHMRNCEVRLIHF